MESRQDAKRTGNCLKTRIADLKQRFWAVVKKHICTGFIRHLYVRLSAGQPPEQKAERMEKRKQNQPADRKDIDRIIPLGKTTKQESRPGPDTCTDEVKSQQEEDSRPVPPPDGGELSRQEVSGIVEALLFAAESPLKPARISELLGLRSTKQAAGFVRELQDGYDRENKPYFVQEVAGGYQLRTRPEFHPWVSKLQQKQQQDTLSQAALETLSIVAYRQPLTRAEIEDIRGVQSGYILRSLIEKALVRVTGRSEELGRPLLYGTTREFLEAFGLASLKDLPALDNPDTPAGKRETD